MDQVKGGASTSILSTDVLLSGDKTLPSGWKSYFDTIARRYFYVNKDGTGEYDHPDPPVFSELDTIVTDESTPFLPAGWMKLKDSTELTYYLNVNSLEASWVHPAPPPNPSTLKPVADPNLLPSFIKYIAPNGSPFYINAVTKEGRWDFPSSAFNPGPSSALAQQASSAVAQTASSAVAQAASSAVAQAASSAQQQAASSAQQQTASSAQAVKLREWQQAQLALRQRASHAIGQFASAAVARRASSAERQTASSAQQQAASSAIVQQASAANASSAQLQRDLAASIANVSGAEIPVLSQQNQVANLVNTLYSSTGNVTMSALSQLQANIATLMNSNAKLMAAAEATLKLDSNYQDPNLQVTIPDAPLTALGLRKVFDILRNSYIVLDGTGAIVPNPITPATRTYRPMRGGKRSNSRRTNKA